MDSEVEIIIQSNGTILVPRGTRQQNDLIRSLSKGMFDDDEIESFLSITDSVDIIFGDTTHCG